MMFRPMTNRIWLRYRVSLIACCVLFPNIAVMLPNGLVQSPATRAAEPEAKPAVGAQGLTRAETLSNALGMKFVLIDPPNMPDHGKFMMGSPVGEPQRTDDEFQHEVTLTRPYYMGMYHVTVAQFAAFVNDTGYKTDAETNGRAFTINAEGTFFTEQLRINWRNPGFGQGKDHPVVVISHKDAKKFVDWLNKKEQTKGRRYRLPTEAEWEYACRAGTRTAYVWGDDPNGGKGNANVGDLALKARFPNWGFDVVNFDDGFVFTSPVGSFKPNGLGLYDMVGNAWQWCDDAFANYPQGAVTDPHIIDQNPNQASHIRRGGSWMNFPRWYRSAVRSARPHNEQGADTGFRVVLDSIPDRGGS